jgi:hypothetical protein
MFPLSSSAVSRYPTSRASLKHLPSCTSTAYPYWRRPWAPRRAPEALSCMRDLASDGEELVNGGGNQAHGGGNRARKSQTKLIRAVIELVDAWIKRALNKSIWFVRESSLGDGNQVLATNGGASWGRTSAVAPSENQIFWLPCSMLQPIRPICDFSFYLGASNVNKRTGYCWSVCL